MKIIYKYAVYLGQNSIILPKDAQILTVDEQHGVFRLWVVVDPNGLHEQREIVIVGTGQVLPEQGKLEHINTFYSESGLYVWHAFEIKNA